MLRLFQTADEAVASRLTGRACSGWSSSSNKGQARHGFALLANSKSVRSSLLLSSSLFSSIACTAWEPLVVRKV